MSDHAIIYDLQYPQGGRLECAAAPDAPCRAVWDCDCESIEGFHVADGVPHHFRGFSDYDASAHHVGRFDPEYCNLRHWHENSDEAVAGTIRVGVMPHWEGDFYIFEAISAGLVEQVER